MGLRRFVTTHASAACHEVEMILVYPPASQALYACYADGCKGLAPPVLFVAKLYVPEVRIFIWLVVRILCCAFWFILSEKILLRDSDTPNTPCVGLIRG